MSNQSVIPPWEELLEKSKNKTTVKWEVRAGQTPSNVAISSYFNGHSQEGKPPVLLYRDTNAWCPFCERVWLTLEEKQIPFEVELINLRNKPKWYTDLVPTGLVPAVKIDEKLVYESKSILLSLEENFTNHGLLPEDKQEKESEKGTIAELQENFETQLNQLEKALEKYPSDYFMRDFGLVDIMYIPSIERLAANLPIFRGYHLLGNEKYPLINRWLKAMNNRPAYQRIKSDARTHNLVMKNVFKLEPLNQELQVMEDEQENNSQQDRLEAAAKLSDNHENVVQDIIKNSGIKSWINDENLEQVEEYINLYLRFLANELLQNHPLPLADEQLMKNNEIAVVGAVSLSYLRNRVCVPRDLTAGAASQFKEAIDKILKCLYSSAF